MYDKCSRGLFWFCCIGWICVRFVCFLLQDLVMGISRTEVNLRRLLAAAEQQQNQAKLIHVCFFVCLEISQIKTSTW